MSSSSGRSRRTLLALLLAAGSASCGSTPPCEIELDLEHQADYEPFECALPAPCGDPRFVGDVRRASSVADPGAAMCILQKLRDREISALTFTNGDNGFGEYTGTETIFVLDAEHGAANWTWSEDLVTTYGRANRQILQPPSYFDGCLAETDAGKIYECLLGWSAGCAEEDVGCPDG